MPRQDGKPVAMRIDSITADPRLQVRALGTDDEHVENIADVLRTKGAKKPPRVKVRQVVDPPGYKPGVYNFTVDGNHTLKAYELAGKKVVPALLKKATWEQAVTDAALSNQGPRALPLRRRDKDKAIKMLLEAHGDDSDEPWSDGLIAKHVGCSPSTVAAKRPVANPGSRAGKRAGADGRAYVNKARPRAEELPGREDKLKARATPLTDPSLELADFELAACTSRNLADCGALYDYIHTGGNLGMKPPRLYNLKTALLELGVGPAPEEPKRAKPRVEPGKNGDAAFNWRAFDESYGVVARAPDVLARLYPDHAAACVAMTNTLTEFRAAFERVRNAATAPEEAK